MKRNTAGQKIGHQMTNVTDGSEFTGTVTVYITGDAGVLTLGLVGAGICTHEGFGYHTYTPAQAETDYDLIAFTFRGTGALTRTIQVKTSFPQTGDSYPSALTTASDAAAIKGKTDNLPADPASQSTSTTIASNLLIVKARTDNLPEGFKKNTAFSNFEFFMADAVDHITAKTGLTIIPQRSIDGAAFGNCSNTAAEVGSGVYKISLSAADLNGDFITFKFSGSGADTTFISIKTEE